MGMPLSPALSPLVPRGERVNCRGIPTAAFGYTLASCVHFRTAGFKLRS